MIEIACSADEGYLPHVSAMLHSVLTHTKKRPLRVWLIHGKELSDEGRERVAAVTSSFGALLEFLPVPQEKMAGFSTKKFHPACWYRMLLPDLLPQLERILYLDCDTIVTDDLQPLWETDLNGRLFGAVCNPLFPLMRNWPKLDLNLPDPLDYLNSGVLLMDLAAMRSEGLVEKLRAYSTAHPDRLLPEQDALSDLMRGRWLQLHPRWNVQTTFYDLPASKLPYTEAVVRETVEHPAIIHYNGPFKPWQYLCKHPLAGLYYRHLGGTSWQKKPLEYASLPYLLIRPLPTHFQYKVLELRPHWQLIRNTLAHWLSKVHSGSLKGAATKNDVR